VGYQELLTSQLEGLKSLDHGFGTRSSEISQARMASLRQIHSAVVIAVTEPGIAGEGDALVTATSGLALSVRTADCYPVLLADRKTRAVAAIHAGWRGTAVGIVPAALSKMTELYGTEPGDVVAAIGPGIGVCCYQSIDTL
jgi:YfiH family protein